MQKMMRMSGKILLRVARFGPHSKNRVSEVTCVKNDAKEKENLASGPTLRVLLKNRVSKVVCVKNDAKE